MEAFHLEHATAAYNGTTVLQDISLSVSVGEKVSLIGVSGSGKSTLLGLLYRQLPERAALVPQDPALVRTLSVFHNTYIGRLDRNSVWYNLLNLAWPLPKEVSAITELLDLLGLAPKLHAAAGELSGGEQQRNAIARALYRGSDILLADEPVSAIDPSQSHTVLKLLTARHETVVLAMHDVRLALEYSSRVIGLRDGRIVLDRPTAGLEPDQLVSFYEG